MFNVKTIKMVEGVKMALFTDGKIPSCVVSYKRYIRKTLYYKSNKRGRIYINIIK